MSSSSRIKLKAFILNGKFPQVSMAQSGILFSDSLFEFRFISFLTVINYIKYLDHLLLDLGTEVLLRYLLHWWGQV